MSCWFMYYTAVNITLCTALHVNLCMQVNVKRMLGVQFAHGMADLAPLVTLHWSSQARKRYLLST